MIISILKKWQILKISSWEAIQQNWNCLYDETFRERIEEDMDFKIPGRSTNAEKEERPGRPDVGSDRQTASGY